MYKKLKTAVVIPAYNEEKLITKTIKVLPEFVDYVIVVNDGSKDDTHKIVAAIAKENKKVILIDNEVNSGIGYTLIHGFKHALAETDAEAIGIVAGDAQFDTSYLGPMLDDFVQYDLDYIKASRFFHREAFKTMPKYRQFGNIFITLLTKFSTGYYTITDITNGCGFLRRSILEKVDFDIVKHRYDYETSMLTALSIVGAKIKDHAVPAHYGEEKSTIKLIPTALRNLRAIWQGFWLRIYYKYVLFNFHPIALFLFTGMLFIIIGLVTGIVLTVQKLAYDLSPSTATVMLCVLPIILGFQMLLTALTMDVDNEGK
jgi:glycosyltransferase involved in cell wall biosynthesis